MKIIFGLLLTLSFVSCGPEVVEELDGAEAQLGETWAIKSDDNFTADEQSLLTSVCSALIAKENYFSSVYASSGTDLNYTVETKGCAQEVSAKNTYVVNVVSQAGTVVFESDTSGIITDVLTNTSRLMKTFCAASDKNMNRYTQTSNSTSWYFLGSGNSGKCKAASDEVCLNIFTGYKASNSDKYTIQNVEEFYVSLSSSPAKYGVATYRAQKNSVSCSDEEEFTTKAQTYVGVAN
jgi:hypothetical protein